MVKNLLLINSLLCLSTLQGCMSFYKVDCTPINPPSRLQLDPATKKVKLVYTTSQRTMEFDCKPFVLEKEAGFNVTSLQQNAFGSYLKEDYPRAGMGHDN